MHPPCWCHSFGSRDTEDKPTEIVSFLFRLGFPFTQGFSTGNVFAVGLACKDSQETKFSHTERGRWVQVWSRESVFIFLSDSATASPPSYPLNSSCLKFF